MKDQELIAEKSSFKVIKSKTIADLEFFAVVRKRDGHYMISTWSKSDAIEDLSYHQDKHDDDLCRYVVNFMCRLFKYA